MVSFGILGPVEAFVGERRVEVGGPRQVALLAFLLVHANRAVSVDQLIDALWGEQDPAGAVKRVQVAVARLRKSLGIDNAAGESPLRSTAGGYLLAVGPDQLDAEVFSARIEEGRDVLESGDAARGAGLLRDALSLWRGPPLAEVAYENFAQGEIRRLEELRLAAIEARAEADLQLGRHAAVIGELQALLVAHPTRERLAELLMLALYRSGRQADALDAYQHARVRLADELGLEPGPALKGLQTQILEQASALEAPNDGESSGRVKLLASGNHGRAAAAQVSGREPLAPVPAAPTPMIGREQEINLLRGLLDRPEVRLVTLHGPGGVGKTRLAIALAQAVTPDFPGGVAWVELAGIARAADVGSTIARAVAVVPLPGESVRDALCRELARKELLLVVDNFEHVLDAAVLIGALLAACPLLSVLATSRELLDLAAEHCVVVAPLPLPRRPHRASREEVESTAATVMFIAAARRHDARFGVDESNAPEIARLCARLDGLPLALELAAAQTRLLGIRELHARLSQAIGELGKGPRDSPARQRTLRATIEWSYGLLDEEQRDAFLRFGVFAGGAGFEAAHIVTGAQLDTLHSLTAKSLLETRPQGDGSIRLVMLETIRHYALQRLAEEPDRDVAHRRHLEHYLQLVAWAVPRLSTHDGVEALTTLDREIDNIRAALQWALTAAPASALQLAGRLGEYWVIRQDPDALSWLTAAIDAAGEDPPARDRARARLYRCMQLAHEDRGDAATAEAESALELYRQAGDHAGIAEALCELAIAAAVYADDVAQDRRYAEQACRHARLAGDDRMLGRALARLAAVSGNRRREVLEQAAEYLARVGDYRELAMAYSNTAYVALAENSVPEAVSLLEVALKAVERVDSAYLEMIVLGNLGLAQLFSGDIDRAEQTFGRQLRLCREHGYRNNSEGVVGMAAVAAGHCHYETAARLRGAARAAGYPPAMFDQHIEARLERDYFVPARERYGLGVWRRAEAEGAALAYEQAVDCALNQPTGPRRDAQRRRRKHAPKLNGGSRT